MLRSLQHACSTIFLHGQRDTYTNRKLGKMKRGNNCTPRLSRVHRCISPVKFRILEEPGLGLNTKCESREKQQSSEHRSNFNSIEPEIVRLVFRRVEAGKYVLVWGMTVCPAPTYPTPETKK